MQAIQNYITKLDQRYQTGISREHAYRGDLQNLLEELLPDILVTNEPAHIACGAPDHILTKINKTGFELDSLDNKTGRVWINEQQYFEAVPLLAWEFYIGGY